MTRAVRTFRLLALSRGAAVGFVLVAVGFAWAERDTRNHATNLAVRNCHQIEAVKAQIVLSVAANDARIDSYKGLTADERYDAHTLNGQTIARFAPLPCPGEKTVRSGS